ncbi:retinoschisin-like [Styela clava]
MMLKICGKVATVTLLIFVMCKFSEARIQRYTNNAWPPSSRVNDRRKSTRYVLPKVADVLSRLVKANPEKLCSLNIDGKLSFTSSAERSTTGVIETPGAWCAETDGDASDSITINLDSSVLVQGVITQGSSHADSYVLSYKVQYSDDGTSYTTITTDDGNDKIFVGNHDNQTPKSNEFKEAITAQYFRIVPVEYFDHKCVRVGLYDCMDILDGLSLKLKD